VEICYECGNEPSGPIKCWEVLERPVASRVVLGSIELLVVTILDNFEDWFLPLSLSPETQLSLLSPTD
jgi:hypothetical protein